jgi:hypothetical protein
MAGPVQVDPTNGGEWAQEYSNATQGPFLIGTSLYAMLSTATDLEIFKSTDGGTTWTQQDAANEPSDPALNGGACWFDGNNTLWVCYSASGGGPAPILVASYDTNTDTWTTGLGSGPNVGVVRACILRTDSTLFIASEGGAAPSGLGFDVFDTIAMGFTVTGDLGTDITTLPEYDPATCTAFNPTFASDGGLQGQANIIWFGYMSLDSRFASQMNNGVYFAAFSEGNATFNFFVVPGQIGNPQPDPPALRCDNGPFQGVPAVCGAGIVVFAVAANTPGNANYASLFVTTDFGATWTFDDAPKGIDPGVTPGITDRAQFAPMSFFDGTKLYCTYAALPGPPSFTFPATAIRLCVTTPNFAANPDTWAFDAREAINISAVPGMTPGVNGFSFPKFTIQDAQNLLSTDIVTFPGLTAWFIPFSFGPAGRVHGTFVGFIQAGQCSGGTK